MRTELHKLFDLTVAEKELTRRLSEIIYSEIKQQAGVIPFSRYMELALYYPGFGYYANPGFKFGAKGDFVTAPLVSNLFGYVLAKQIAEIFSFGVKPQILEFGAGNGKLAVDILNGIGDNLESYHILELSADLAKAQYEMLAQKTPQHLRKVNWLTGLPAGFNGVMLANEVLDAQPCDIVYFKNGKISGVGVGVDQDKLVYKNYVLDDYSLSQAQELNLNYTDYQTEIHLANAGFMHSLAESLIQGAILLLDYGYGEREYYHPQKNKGTLRGFFRQHVVEDVLGYPGLIDITSSVNWTKIATSATNHGLELIGYTSQANFLLNCGLSEDLLHLRQQLSDVEYLQISNQINKLISITEMGDIFKVMGFSKNITADTWLGFKTGDRSHSL